jgi:multidrug resistance efflux pump
VEQVSEGELLFATDPSSANAEVQLAETDVMEGEG